MTLNASKCKLLNPTLEFFVKSSLPMARDPTLNESSTSRMWPHPPLSKKFEAFLVWPDILTSFKHIKDELTVTNNGIILRRHRIVLPQALQQCAIDIAHETHLGLTKTKALIREKIWFPNIDAMVKTTLDRCLTFQALGRPGPPAPITPTTMPDGPWQTVHVDFYGPLPTGEYLLVVVDRYSRFPEVEIVHSTRASTVIPKLDKIFAVRGIPTLLKSDNGPPFNGEEYQRYLTALGIKAIFSTPKWPQGKNASCNPWENP